MVDVGRARRLRQRALERVRERNTQADTDDGVLAGGAGGGGGEGIESPPPQFGIQARVDSWDFVSQEFSFAGT